MRLALLQTSPLWHDARHNTERATKMIREAAHRGAYVAVLPEMFSTGYSMDTIHAVEPIDGPTSEALAAAAAEGNINIIAGMATEGGHAGMGKNQALVFDRKGRMAAEYTKIHPFVLAAEADSYEPGASAVVFGLDGVHASVFICYDLRFPEVFRAVAQRVSVIYVIASWPASRAEHWRALMRARAIENLCYVVGVNRTGLDGNGVGYMGMSCVYGPLGEELLMAGEAEGIYYCDIDPDRVDEVRREYPFLQSIRKI